MKTLAIVTVAALLIFGACWALTEVQFVYFNLSGKEIYVAGISGLPPVATPGVLMPSRDENNRLERSTVALSEVVRIGPRIKITWEESGAPHEFEIGREDLRLPSKLRRGTIRFTYLGNDKWRIARLK